MSTTFNKTIEKLKYDLVRDGVLNYDDLIRAERFAKNKRIGLSQAIIQLNIIQEEKLLSFIESKLHIPYVNLDDYTLDKSCLIYISENDARNYKLIPLFKIEDVLTIAMADPLDLFILNNLMNSIECKIEPVVCFENNILKAIDENYSTKDLSDLQEKSQLDWRKELTNENPDDLQAEKIIGALLCQAKLENVSEVFIEPAAEGMIIKFKKDNQTIVKGTIPVLLTPIIMLGIKALANLNVAISDFPQLGRLELSYEGENIITSISTFPTMAGERVCFKIFKPYTSPEDLQINPEIIINKPGLVIVAGTDFQDTNLVIYSLLSSINKNKNVMTIESTMKYRLDNVNQVELNEKVGFNIDKVARFLGFQSPDIVYLEDILAHDNIKLFLSLISSGKIIITELLAGHISEDILKNLVLKDYKDYISCLILVEDINKIKVLTI